MFIVSVKTTLDHKRVTSKFNKSTTNCGGQISLNKCIHSKIFAFLFINFPYSNLGKIVDQHLIYPKDILVKSVM